MLVKHLIRELQKCNPEAQVWTEGCDCTGDSLTVVHVEEGWVEIARSDRPDHRYDNTTDTPKPL